MEMPTRTLVQERAILVAKQGDPKSPAPGTLLARQKLLHVELEAAHARDAKANSQVAPTVEGILNVRLPDQIRRDIRRVERELAALQSRLREIDQAVAIGAEKRRS